MPSTNCPPGYRYSCLSMTITVLVLQAPTRGPQRSGIILKPLGTIEPAVVEKVGTALRPAQAVLDVLLVFPGQAGEKRQQGVVEYRGAVFRAPAQALLRRRSKSYPCLLTLPSWHLLMACAHPMFSWHVKNHPSNKEPPARKTTSTFDVLRRPTGKRRQSAQGTRAIMRPTTMSA